MSENKVWYSLKEASLELGYCKSYMSIWLHRHSKELPNGVLIEAGKSKIISKEGIQWIKHHTNKVGRPHK